MKNSMLKLLLVASLAVAWAVVPPAKADWVVSYSAPLFYQDLSPHGSWFVMHPYGWVWQPQVVSVSAGWRPYCHGGAWLWTDYGWYWDSSYSWGWIPFHFGWWVLDPYRGWVWVPGSYWAPAWVCWRTAPGYYGWAPLPPPPSSGAYLGLGFDSGGISFGVSIHLTSAHYMFVAEDDICKPEVHCRTAPPADAQAVYEGSAPRVDFGGIREKAATVLANRPAIASIPQVQAFMQRASAREPADVGPRSVAAPVRVDMAGARLRVPDTVRVAADDFRSQADPARRQAAACAAAARLPAPVPRAGRPSVAAPDSHIDSPGRAIQLATRPAAAPSGGAAPSGRRAAAAAAEGVAARQAVHAVAASGRGQAVRDRIENGW